MKYFPTIVLLGRGFLSFIPQEVKDIFKSDEYNLIIVSSEYK